MGRNLAINKQTSCI